ncbi:glycosyltransferase [Salinirubrum litoreum]|uniref:Glycosyltransferase n=1 Tax=Salinirubrum litoreum TaxID=1126234 RepID=A0ABD5R6D2_9EURY|nr:glycosyltransferase family 2 protein [Salinirubrum litoreum]
MKVERYTLVAVTAALVVGGVSLLVPGQRFDIPAVDATGLLAASLWATTILFAAATVVWLVLTYVVGRGYDIPEAVHGGETVQVRILTVDAASVVQQTVDSLPEELADVHVIAEAAIDVDGATVHVVPEEFECSAVRKGRALEWGRRHIPCDREYVLYLDEDSIVERFAGLPDAGVVQLREKPRRTGSVLSYLADVFRMGVQLEQRAFARLSIPLFAWGGGIAVRKELEDEVTWDRETLVEDTAFVWAAAQQRELDFELADVICRNEAPPSLGEILQQRRRWAAGNLRAATMLPLHYRALTRFRNSAWALSPIVTLVVVPLSVLGITVVSGGLFALASLGLAVATLFWYLRGVAYYGGSKLAWALAVPLTPVVTLVHSMGTVLGVVDPPEDFRVTEKAGTEDDD